LNSAGMWIVAVVVAFLDETWRVSTHTQTFTELCEFAPDDGLKYHPKHVEQFPDKINCVNLHLVGYTCILEYQQYNLMQLLSFINFRPTVITAGSNVHTHNSKYLVLEVTLLLLRIPAVIYNC
jgi:hypothetical protein